MLLAASVLVGAACSPGRSSDGDTPIGAAAGAPDPAARPIPPTASVATTSIPSTPDPTTTPPTSPTTTIATTTTTPTTTLPPTTLPPTTTTTTLPPLPPGTHNPKCVRVIRPGDSLSVLVDEIGREGVSVATLQAENRIVNADRIEVGDLIDFCVENVVNDITGEPREAPAAELVDTWNRSGVEAQQRKVAELLTPYSAPELLADGISGPRTRQQLCTARLLLGLPVSREDMQPGSAEEQALMDATGVGIPAGAATDAGRWVLIDKTCQILIAGEGERIEFVFPASTGEPGWETGNKRVRAFRFDPALENDGWHNSTKFPVPEDNPLNGNMYRPVYFYRGQAIHGAGNVPPEPASKGCVRLRVHHQDQLVSWLGLDGADGPFYDEGRIGLTVTVQGEF